MILGTAAEGWNRLETSSLTCLAIDTGCGLGLSARALLCGLVS